MPRERKLFAEYLFKKIDDNNMYDYKEVVEHAHKKFDLLNIKNELGNTPLLHALKAKNIKAAEILVEAKANCDVQDKDGNTPLHLAINMLDMSLADIQKLIANMSDVNVLNTAGQTPLMTALTSKRYPASTTLDKIIYSGHDIALALLDAKATPCAGFDTLLRYAIKTNDDYHLDYLIQLKANPNTSDEDSPLFHALHSKNSSKYVAKLLEAKADPNFNHLYDETPLYTAAQKGDVSSVKLLIEAKADIHSINHGSYTPLEGAFPPSDKNTADIIKILLAEKANPNVLLFNERPILAGACFYAGLHKADLFLMDIVKKLIESKADINKQSKSSGLTALHNAALFDNPELVKLLIVNNANPLIKNTQGLTALAFGRKESSGDSNDRSRVIKLLENVTPSIWDGLCGFWKTKTAASDTASEQVKETKAKPPR